jgi:hypothetical protein
VPPDPKYNGAGAVDRAVLSTHVLGPGKEQDMTRLEESIHPLVATAREKFLTEVRSQQKPLLLQCCCFNAAFFVSNV